jgi:hypothetical protein
MARIFHQKKVTETIWLLLVALSLAETIWSVSSICLLMLVKFCRTLSIAFFLKTGEIKSRMVIINAVRLQHINDWIFSSRYTQKEIAPI